MVATIVRWERCSFAFSLWIIGNLQQKCQYLECPETSFWLSFPAGLLWNWNWLQLHTVQSLCQVSHCRKRQNSTVAARSALGGHVHDQSLDMERSAYMPVRRCNQWLCSLDKLMESFCGGFCLIPACEGSFLFFSISCTWVLFFFTSSQTFRPLNIALYAVLTSQLLSLWHKVFLFYHAPPILSGTKNT